MGRIATIFNLGPDENSAKVSWIAQQIVLKCSPKADFFMDLKTEVGKVIYLDSLIVQKKLKAMDGVKNEF